MGASNADTLCRSLNRVYRTTKEEKELSSAIASIRLHANYQDPLEEWQRQVKIEAFVSWTLRRRDRRAACFATEVYCYWDIITLSGAPFGDLPPP